MQYPWTITIAIAVMYYIFIIGSLFTWRGRKVGWETCYYSPGVTLLVPIFLSGVYYWYTRNAGGAHLGLFLYVLCYLYIPALLIWTGKKSGMRPNWWDAVAILFLWIPFDLHLDRHLVGRRPGAIRDALDWPLVAVSAVIVALIFWVCLRKMGGTKTVFRFQWRDLPITIAALFSLALVLVPLGMWTGFLVPREFWKEELKTMSIAQIVFAHLSTGTFAVYMLKIYPTIGLSEEVLFRGITQNFLGKVLPSKKFLRSWVPSLLLASVLFGAAHLNNGATSIHPSGWNWSYMGMASIAGLAYGLVFRFTSSILYPILLHTLVDSIWHTLFK